MRKRIYMCRVERQKIIITAKNREKLIELLTQTNFEGNIKLYKVKILKGGIMIKRYMEEIHIINAQHLRLEPFKET